MRCFGLQPCSDVELIYRQKVKKLKILPWNVALKPEELKFASCFIVLPLSKIHIEALYPFWILLLGAHRLVYHIFSVYIYVYIIDQTRGQDGWILAKFFFCVFIKKRKKRMRPIPSHLDRTCLANRRFIIWHKEPWKKWSSYLFIFEHWKGN